MRKIFVLFFCTLFFLSACSKECRDDEWYCSSTNECIKKGEICTNGLDGGDSDEFGCKPSTGYTWCEAKQKCIAEWNEPCVENKTE